MESQYTSMLRIGEVCRRTGLSKSQIHRLVSEMGFPKPVRLSKRAVAFVAADVEAWLQERITATREVA